MHSRMGTATESHFTNLNTAIIERKQSSRVFEPDKVLNPALRATIKAEDESNTADFIKVKTLFMGEEAKKRMQLKSQVLILDNKKPVVSASQRHLSSERTLEKSSTT